MQRNEKVMAELKPVEAIKNRKQREHVQRRMLSL